jgi:ferredoxin-NADP reductase/c-di-GMP-binding flagellar brake protein YcgR
LPRLNPPQLAIGKVIDLSISDGRKNAKYRARIEQISGHDLWLDVSLTEASLPFKAGALVSGYCLDEHFDGTYRFLSRIKRKHLDKPQRILIQTPTELARTERRVFMRAALSFKATLTPLAADGLEDASLVADCNDVSAGGALFSVSSDYSFALAQSVQLDFTLPDGRQLSSAAMVVRIDTLLSADQRRFTRVAVLFVDMHDADQEHLSKIVFQHWSGLFLDKQQFAAQTWKNSRLFRVDATVDEGGQVKSFYLKPQDGRRLPPFKSGQFLTFQLAIGQNKKVIRRCYSLSDSPSPDYFRVSIKRAAAPKDQPLLPSGLSSSFFHDYVSAGTLLEVMQPAGSFYLDDQDMRAIVLIGGGIGITPVLSMLNHLTRGGFTQPIYLFLGFRNQAEHVFKTHLEAIAATHPQVQIIVCYSNPALDDQQGKDYQVKGYVSAKLITQTIATLDSHFYLCGPPVFMQSITEGLIQAGAQTEDVRFEAFGSASVASCNHPDLPVKKDAKITFVNAEQSYAWSDKAKTILELAELNGVTLPYGCRAGNCHACAIEIQSGEVLYLKNPEPPPELGACLTCIAVPKTDLVLVDPH